jgi:pyruvate-ferredoxin/flavodoxin oxidoreductase
MQRIEVLEYDELAKLIDMDAVKAFRDRALNPEHPELRGISENPDIFWQQSEAVNKFYIPIPDIVQDYMDKINALTGRNYKLYNYYGSPTAQDVIIAMGSGCDTIRETIDHVNKQGANLGLLEVHLYRPFLGDMVIAALPKTVKRICVLDRAKENGAYDPLSLDVRSAFLGQKNAPLIISGRYGIASKEFNPSHVMAVYENLASKNPKDRFTIGITDDVTFTSIEPSKTPIAPTPEGTPA